MPSYEEEMKWNEYFGNQRTGNIRKAQIIDAALSVERVINELILNYFADKNKKEEFRVYILEKEFFTFEQKIKIFNRIADKNFVQVIEDKVLSNKGYYQYCSNIKNLKKEIEFVRKIRNIMAHTFLNPNNSFDSSYLTFNFEGEEIELNSNFVNAYVLKTVEIITLLYEIIDFLKIKHDLQS